MMTQPISYTKQETYSNFVYDLAGVRHINCHQCLPDNIAWRALKQAGILIEQGFSTRPCESCGGYDLIVPEESEGNYARTDLHHPRAMARGSVLARRGDCSGAISRPLYPAKEFVVWNFGS
jgi:hypothetical protein